MSRCQNITPPTVENDPPPMENDPPTGEYGRGTVENDLDPHDGN